MIVSDLIARLATMLADSKVLINDRSTDEDFDISKHILFQLPEQLVILQTADKDEL